MTDLMKKHRTLDCSKNMNTFFAQVLLIVKHPRSVKIARHPKAYKGFDDIARNRVFLGLAGNSEAHKTMERLISYGLDLHVQREKSLCYLRSSDNHAAHRNDFAFCKTHPLTQFILLIASQVLRRHLLPQYAKEQSLCGKDRQQSLGAKAPSSTNTGSNDSPKRRAQVHSPKHAGCKEHIDPDKRRGHDENAPPLHVEQAKSW